MKRSHPLRGDALTLVCFERPGSGTPIVLLHGVGGNALVWGGLARQLPGRHLIALDLPGHGQSPEPASFALEPMAGEIATLVTRRLPSGVIWAGHSWGAKLALAAALADPSARGLVLVDTAPIPRLRSADPDAVVSDLFAGELEPWPSWPVAVSAARRLPQYTPWTEEVARAFRRGVTFEADGRVVPKLSRAKALDLIGTIFETDFTQHAARLRVPALVVNSGMSDAARKANRRLLPAATHVDLSGNHWLHVNDLDALATAIRAWLAEWDR
jgi:pimeloyl-ACP methyl ester carboxylesterase